MKTLPLSLSLSPSRRRRAQRGVALLEAMLAIVILAIGLLGTVGMQARAYSALSESSMRAEATLAAESLLGIMSTDVSHLDSYAYAHTGTPNAVLTGWYNATRASIPGAVIDITVAKTTGTERSKVDIAIAWTRKSGAATNTHRVTSYISP
ncbi:MAG: prepilin-type N-terminal cleavage/methylation domain-containing protein [Massilia sp.]